MLLKDLIQRCLECGVSYRDVDMCSFCLPTQLAARDVCPVPVGLVIGMVHGMCPPTNRITPRCGRSKIDEDQDFQKQNEDTDALADLSKAVVQGVIPV